MGEQQKILVVDDDKFNAELLREICENAGYLVFVAHEGFQALDRARAENPDLILLDIMMGSKDGFQVCRELRADPNCGEIPIILVTAVDDLDSKIRGIELGADDYVTKPFRMFDLQSRIQSAIDLRRLAQVGCPDAAAQAPERRRGPGRVGAYRQLRWDLIYEYRRALRYAHPLACALLIVENYEALYGEGRKKEAAGLIAAVVSALQRNLRSVDRIYRIDDDAFVVVMPETDTSGASVPLDRVCLGLQAPEASTTGPVILSTALVGHPALDIGSAEDLLRRLTERLRDTRPDLELPPLDAGEPDSDPPPKGPDLMQ